MRKLLLSCSLLALLGAPTSLSFPVLRARPLRPVAAKSVSQTLAMMGLTSVFYASLRADKLDSLLNIPKATYTVFAPTNEAFNRLKERGVALASSTEKGLDQHQLELLLRFHLVPGRYPTEALKAGQALRTLNGAFTIKVTTQGTSVWVGGTNTPPVELQNAYILCSNGVIHLIDDVMIPFVRAAKPAAH